MRIYFLLNVDVLFNLHRMLFIQTHVFYPLHHNLWRYHNIINVFYLRASHVYLLLFVDPYILILFCFLIIYARHTYRTYESIQGICVRTI